MTIRHSARQWSALALAPLLANDHNLLAQQPDSTILPRVVVTATRVDTALGADLSTVTVLRGDVLRRSGVRSVADALRMVPGVSIVRGGGPGAQTSLFLRGGESDYVRVLVDGVPINDPGGSIDLASLTLDNVDRVEVVRGPVSVLYGTDAVTGVIQIFTRDAVGRATGDAGIRVGRYGSEIRDASLSARAQRVSGIATVARENSDGILAFNNQYRNDVISARLSLAPAEGSRASVTARFTDDEFHFPTDGNGDVVDRNAGRTERRRIVAMDAEQRIGTRVRAAVSVSALDGRGRFDDAADGPADTTGLYSYWSASSLRRRVGDARLHFSPFTATILTAGAEWMVETQRSTDSSNYSFARSQFGEDRSNRAVYTQLLGESGRLSYAVGARHDQNRVFGGFRTARANLAYRAWKGGAIRASLGTAFKAPTFFESFSTSFSVGNSALEPERSRSWEIAAEHRPLSGLLSLSAVWFDQRFRDLIQYTFKAPDLPNYFNVAAASARGLELQLSARLSSVVRTSGSVTLLRTRVGDAGFDTTAGASFVRGQRLLRRPGQTGAVSLTTSPSPRAVFSATALYIGKRDDRDFRAFPAKPVVLPAYTRVDVGGEYLLVQALDAVSSVTIMARAENVLGARYEEVFRFPAPGRAFSVGIRVGVSR